MPWGRLDDSLYDHPKLDLLGSQRMAGVGLWAVSISWCNRRLTDGFLPASRIRQLGGTVRLAERLVEVGLFDRAEGGYLVHDFLEFNDSKLEAEAKQRQRRDAGRLGGQARSTRPSEPLGEPPSEPLNGSVKPVPSRPVPSSPEGNTPREDDPAVVYANLSGGWPSSGALDWIDRLTSEYGPEAVIKAIGKARAPKGQLISAIQDVLRADARELSKSQKVAAEAKVAEKRQNGMLSRRLDYYRSTGKWPSEWGDPPVAA